MPALTAYRIARMTTAPTVEPPAPRKGHLHLFESSVSVWEDNVEDSIKPKVFDEIVRFLRSRGWLVQRDQHIHKHYRCLSPKHRYCRLGDLEASLEVSGRHLKFEMFQNVANVENSHGGKHDFNKLARMPYVLRLRCLSTMLALANFLRARHGYPVKSEDMGRKDMGPGGMTALDFIAAYYAESWHTDKALGRPRCDYDYNRKSGDGHVLEHGQAVWVADRNGRWLRGTAYYNINGMWWVVVGPYDYRNMSCGAVFVDRPADLRAKHNERQRRARLEKELSEAVRTMNFDRAALIKRILFGADPLFRVWSDKHSAWYRPQSCGYTTDASEAGLYREDEARREVSGCDDLKMIPTVPPRRAAA